jgi:hypothetical protein
MKVLPKIQGDQLFQGQMAQANLICECGERMRDEAYIIIVRREKMTPTPEGMGPGLGQSIVHSITDCEKFETIRNDPQTVIICWRKQKTEPIVWADEYWGPPITDEELDADKLLAESDAIANELEEV